LTVFRFTTEVDGSGALLEVEASDAVAAARLAQRFADFLAAESVRGVTVITANREWPGCRVAWLRPGESPDDYLERLLTPGCGKT
jgi:hypothetical protein